MSETTKIAWTGTLLPDGDVVPGYTANWWWGCSRVSPGCRNCYADTWATRLGKDLWSKDSPREPKKGVLANVRKWNKMAKESGIRYKVFAQSMADLFEDHSGVVDLRARACEQMEECTHLDWLVLTKRIQNVSDMVPAAWMENWPANVWLGTSVENQHFANQRIPILTKIPAKVVFLSCEPLLGPLDLEGLAYESAGPEWAGHNKLIDWIIVGGESGHGARPMKAEWAMSILEQCRTANISFFFKQLGSVWSKQLGLLTKGDLLEEIPEDFRVRQFPALF